MDFVQGPGEEGRTGKIARGPEKERTRGRELRSPQNHASLQAAVDPDLDPAASLALEIEAVPFAVGQVGFHVQGIPRDLVVGEAQLVPEVA